MSLFRKIFRPKGQKPVVEQQPERPNQDQTVSIENVGNEASTRLLKKIVESKQTGDDYFSHLTSITAQFMNENPAYIFAPHIQIEIGSDHRIEIAIANAGVYITGFDTSDISSPQIVRISGADGNCLEFEEHRWDRILDGFYNVAQREYQVRKDIGIIMKILENAHNQQGLTREEMRELDSFLFESEKDRYQREIPQTTCLQPWRNLVRLPENNSVGVIMSRLRSDINEAKKVIIWDPKNQYFIRTYIAPEQVDSTNPSEFNYQALRYVDLGFWKNIDEFINTFPLHQRLRNLVQDFGNQLSNWQVIIPIKFPRLVELTKAFRKGKIESNLDLTTCDFYTPPLYPNQIEKIKDGKCPDPDNPTVLLELVNESTSSGITIYRMVYNILFQMATLQKFQ
ncbi:MAG TPA: hypothetical protein PK957_01900 [Candidatus Dojkabacteria bacterium]|nr:hypothetical protein [Candidatus Dojkabacteria bacterium]HQF36878.1 hypothetical protein [Candidatus Dojkabacteria bacterium]